MTPKRSYRIAHLSDFHLVGQDEDFDRCLALADDARDQGAEHLVVSGDLVESGEMAVLRAFVAGLKRRGWAGSNRLTIVPGNHDIFPFTKRKIPTLRRPTSIFDDFVAITRGSRTGKGFRSLIRGSAYPFGKVLNEHVVLAGVDTTRNGQFNPLQWASGEFPGEQMGAVEEFFARWGHVPHRVLVMHHHPWAEVFEGGGMIEQNFVDPPPEEVFEWIEDFSQATLVLCGHVHRKDGIEIRRFGRRGKILRAGTAGGVDDEENGQKRRVYHLLDLARNGSVRIRAQEFRDRDL